MVANNPNIKSPSGPPKKSTVSVALIVDIAFDDMDGTEYSAVLSAEDARELANQILVQLGGYKP